MISALQIVASGSPYMPPEARRSATFVAGDPRDPGHSMTMAMTTATALPGISQRQLAVLRLVFKGHSNREIGEALGITENTVKHHASAAYKALGVSSGSAAMVALVKRGIDLQ